MVPSAYPWDGARVAGRSTCLLDVFIFHDDHVLRQQLAREADVHRSLCKPSQVHALRLSARSRSPAPAPGGPAHHGGPGPLRPPPPTSLLAAVIGPERMLS